MGHNRSDKLIREVEKKEKLISKNPDMGSISEIEGIQYVLIDKNFSLYYRTNKDVVEILAFWDNRGNPENLNVK
uniref:Type II toxin-antitoxin system RelE/ParE family toxin n=1 Tax=Chryseobacterium endophyticum TaxID=1854762 RepID=A0AAU6WW98_9FLAO